ncbi:MAG: EAL domain-containing protein [Rhizobiaceae bacterium]|nr:EAL domain-containing protein [Rhizobiaceae bacterium]
MKRFKPALWLSFGLICLTLALTLTAYVLGLIPDGYKAELDSRAKVAESIAVQLATAANRNDQDLMDATLSSIVVRNEDVLSAAIRSGDGTILKSAGNHAESWVASKDGHSTPTHVTVPLESLDGQHSAIEISFGSASNTKRYAGIPSSLLLFLLYLAGSGFLGYFLLLRRTLKQLDPGRVIPERVQKAFDTLAEGVLILDEKERILLVNNAFATFYGDGGPPVGTKINNLSWRMVDGSAAAGGYPWHIALRENCDMCEDALSLRTARGEMFNFDVNAATITNDSGRLIGAIVTLRDLTSLRRSNEELSKTLQRLKQHEEQLAVQAKELAYFTQHDSLTGSLNRKTFADRLAADINSARLTPNTPGVGVLAIKIKNLSKLNDATEPAIGDNLLISVADHLKGLISDTSYLARYASDEYCIALTGRDVGSIGEIGEAVKNSLMEGVEQFTDGNTPVSLAIGWTTTQQEGLTASELMYGASKACVVVTTNTATPTTAAIEAAMAAEPASLIQAPVLAAGKAEPDTRHTAHFEARLNHARNIADRSQRPVAVVQFAVIGWRYLQEALGGDEFEKLIQEVQQKMSTAMPSSNVVVALKGRGEILTFFDHIEGESEVEFMVARILSTLRAPFSVGSKMLYVSCKAGIAMYPEHGTDNEMLTHHAAVAVTRAMGENQIEGFKYYHPSMIEESRSRLDIESGIREALQNDEFLLTFQPIVDCQSGALSAVETLLRCNNESLSGVRIDQIIDVAEQSSLIAEIDMWVLTNALTQMQTWCDADIPIPKISINISANQLTNMQFMESVMEAINQIRFSPSRVQIEVTETAKMDDVGIAAPQLKRLQHFGVIIALDDFGTGQASLTYLQRLHPDVIKLDRSFVTGVNSNHANATLVSATTVMAQCLGLKVVVKGVETREQLQFLRETGCDEIQGFLISKPMPAEVITDWIKVYADGKGANEYVTDNRPAYTSNLVGRNKQTAA